MRFRNLGKSGLRVSEICLGTMMFGGRTDATAANAIIAHARDHDVNFIDTANAYTSGRSEEIIGGAIARDRARWILATKLGNPTGTDPNSGGLSRRHVVEACEDSLRRLKTDYVDCLSLHREDHGTPLEETVLALGLLLQQGKIRYFGISNFRSWRIAEVWNLSRQAGLQPPIVSQPYYNAFNRMPEVEHFAACRHYGIGVVPYSPLARGVLTAKYAPDAKPAADTRAGVNDARMQQTEWRPESLVLAQRIRAYCEGKGITPVQFAIAWVLNCDVIAAAVAGPRTLEQWQEYLTALDVTLTDEDEKFVDSLVVPGHPSTPGYNDPAYPLEGRRPR